MTAEEKYMTAQGESPAVYDDGKDPLSEVLIRGLDSLKQLADSKASHDGEDGVERGQFCLLFYIQV